MHYSCSAVLSMETWSTEMLWPIRLMTSLLLISTSSRLLYKDRIVVELCWRDLHTQSVMFTYRYVLAESIYRQYLVVDGNYFSAEMCTCLI